MEKIILFFIIALLTVFVVSGLFGCQSCKKSEKISSAEQLQKLNLIIFKNTQFRKFTTNRFSFQYPDWEKLDIDPLLIWPVEIAKQEEILLYLTNPDGVKVLAKKRKLTIEECQKPYPLLFREIFTKETKIMQEQGGLTGYQIIRENFFENGILLESKMIIFGQSISSISKSVIIIEGDRGFIYSVAISTQDKIFEDYRLLINYIIDSVRYY